MDLMVILGIVLAWIFWRWSEDCFVEDKPYAGYFFLVVSAANMAYSMSVIF